MNFRNNSTDHNGEYSFTPGNEEYLGSSDRNSLGFSGAENIYPSNVLEGFEINMNGSDPCISPMDNSAYDGEELFNENLPINVDELFDLLFTPSDFFVDFHASREHTNLQQTLWKKNDATGEKIRHVSFIAPLTRTLVRGTIKVFEEQVMSPCTILGFTYCVDVGARCIGIPYTVSFTTETRFGLTRISDVETTLQIFSRIEFGNHSWLMMKDLMKKFCWSGLKDYVGNFTEAVTNKIGEIEESNGLETKVRLKEPSAILSTVENSTLFDCPVEEELHDNSNIPRKLREDIISIMKQSATEYSSNFAFAIDGKLDRICHIIEKLQENMVSIVKPISDKNSDICDGPACEELCQNLNDIPITHGIVCSKIQSCQTESVESSEPRENLLSRPEQNVTENSEPSPSSLDILHGISDSLNKLRDEILTMMRMRVAENSKSFDGPVDEKLNGITNTSEKPQKSTLPMKETNLTEELDGISREPQDGELSIVERNKNEDLELSSSLFHENLKENFNEIEEHQDDALPIMNLSMNESSNVVDSSIGREHHDTSNDLSEVRKNTLPQKRPRLTEDSGYSDSLVVEQLDDTLSAASEIQRETTLLNESCETADLGSENNPVDEGLDDISNTIDEPQERILSITESNIGENPESSNDSANVQLCVISYVIEMPRKNGALNSNQILFSAVLFLIVINGLLCYKCFGFDHATVSTANETQAYFHIIALRIWQKIAQITAELVEEIEEPWINGTVQQYHEDL